MNTKNLKIRNMIFIICTFISLVSLNYIIYRLDVNIVFKNILCTLFGFIFGFSSGQRKAKIDSVKEILEVVSSLENFHTINNENTNNLELNNVVSNCNKSQKYKCPNYIVALLREIQRQLDRIMWNINQKHYDNPFENSGNSFSLGNFVIQAYSWNDEVEQEYNFIYKVDKSKANMPDLKISWYKYLGRDTTINQEVDENVMVSIFNDVISQLLQFEKQELDNKK